LSDGSLTGELAAPTSAGADASAGPRTTESLPVTVLIPAHERADMLRRSLASVWAQTPRVPAEVIVVDDGSRDDTSAVARELGAHVIRHPENRGPSAARNTGLAAASHQWIALLDSDDEWLAHHLDHVWAMRHSHVLVAGSSLNCSSDPARDRFCGPTARKPVILSSGEQLIFPGNTVPTSASLFRHDLAVELGGFRSHRDGVEDFDMWLRLLEHGTAICSPAVSVIYHVHGGQLSLLDARTMQLGHIDAAEAHRARTGGTRKSVELWEGVAAWDNLRRAVDAGRTGEAVQLGLHLAMGRRRLAGLLRIWARRWRIRRRSRQLRSEGVGPSSRSAAHAVEGIPDLA
jgi:GT2 family glycosyltransferase